MGKTALPYFSRTLIRNILTTKKDLAFLYLAESGDRLNQLTLSISIDTCHADNLAGLDMQGHAPDLRCLLLTGNPHILNLQNRISHLRISLINV